MDTRLTAGHAIARWLVDAVLCALVAAALYGGMRPDPTTFDRLTRRPGARNQPADRDALRSNRQSCSLAASRNGASAVLGRGRKAYHDGGRHIARSFARRRRR